MKEDLGCYECYKAKPSLLGYCEDAPNISDIEAYEQEMRGGWEWGVILFPVIE